MKRLALYAGALLIFLWSASPFIWQFSTSFQLDRALTSGTPTLWPDPWTFEHYRNVFVKSGMVSTVTTYHKGYSITGSTKIIHRYLLKEIRELLIYYLWIVRHNDMTEHLRPPLLW